MEKRIQRIMKESGMNQKEFSQATGIAPATLSNIFSGRTSATINHLRAIHDKFPNLKLEWLLTGDGEMYESKQPGEPKTSSPTLFDNLNVEQSPTGNHAAEEAVNTSVSREAILDTVKEVAKQITKPQRNVVEIRVFFDDDTYDVFLANRK